MIWLLAIVAAILLYEELIVNASPNSVAGYAKQAGFTGADLIIAVAIAYAESAGNPNAIGDQDIPVAGAQSVGLWQINTYYHPEVSAQALLDPQTNANEAFKVYQDAGNSFTPWSTFNSGKYQSYTTQAQSEVQSADAGTDTGADVSDDEQEQEDA